MGMMDDSDMVLFFALYMAFAVFVLPEKGGLDAIVVVVAWLLSVLTVRCGKWLS